MNKYYLWFEQYLQKYLVAEKDIVVNYELKQEHTYRVRDNILKIGRSLNLDNKSLMLCEIIGLFHDVGRFKQYHENGTFSDSITGSHAKLSIEILIENNVLLALTDFEKEIVIKAIDYHNCYEIPENETEEIKMFCRLIRDADKLDAFWLETNRDDIRKYDLGKLSEEREYSLEIIEDLINSRQVDFRNIKYTYDRKLSILGFIFDLNYKESYRVLKSNSYISIILNDIPNSKDIKIVQEHCNHYSNSRLKGF